MGTLQPVDRSGIIDAYRQIADALSSQAPRVIALLEAIEPTTTARTELDKTVRALRTYVDELRYLHGRSPLGRIAVMLPFNTPLYSLILYCFGPLLAGNSVTVRPSSLTASCLRGLIELMSESLRPLRLDFTTMSGSEFLTEALLNHPVDALVFTGTWSNLQLMLPRVPPSMRLIYCGGGLNSFVVLPGADLPAAVDTAMRDRLFNSGQDCLSPERFLVSTSLAPDFLCLLVESISRLRTGALPNNEIDVGPLTPPGAGDNIARLLDESVAAGDTIHVGRVDGNLVVPTVVTTSLDHRILHVEKFAPVFPVATVDSLGTVVRFCNASQYQFGVTVFGDGIDPNDLSAPHVAINESLLDMESADAHVPFGGTGRSGFVRHGNMLWHGPILLSVETSVGDSSHHQLPYGYVRSYLEA